MDDKPTYLLKVDDYLITKGRNAGKGHIKLWVTFRVRSLKGKKWPQRPYQTNLYSTPEDFDRVMDYNNNRIPTLLKDLRIEITKITAKADNIIDKLNVRDEANFKRLFESKLPMSAIKTEYDLKIDELLDTGTPARPKKQKHSSAEKYNTSFSSIDEFFNADVKEGQERIVVTYDMLTPENLQAYEDWYIQQPKSKNSHEKKSLTSVGINMRHCRHICKRAIKKNLMASLPFGPDPLYTIPEGGDDTKAFLESEDRSALITWRQSESQEAKQEIFKNYMLHFRRWAFERYDNFKEWIEKDKEDLYWQFVDEVIEKRNTMHDYAIFSYFAFGMNLADVARLRKTKVFPKYISLDRQKTHNRKKKKKSTAIPRHPVMDEIMKRRGNKSLRPDDYVFPILDYSDDEETIFKKIRNFTDDVNHVLAIAHKELGFEFKPTSYTMRHTFSWDFMQQEGSTTEDLQHALTHGTISTTEAYKHGFGLDRKKRFSDGLGK